MQVGLAGPGIGGGEAGKLELVQTLGKCLIEGHAQKAVAPGKRLVQPVHDLLCRRALFSHVRQGRERGDVLVAHFGEQVFPHGAGLFRLRARGMPCRAANCPKAAP